MQSKKQFSLSERFKSFQFAWNGMVKVFVNEHNMWIHLFAALAVVVAGFYFELNNTEWMMICIAIAMVIAAEMFNSSIEKLVDLVSPEQNEKAGLIKDIAAGAVLVCAIFAVIIGLIIFIPKIF